MKIVRCFLCAGLLASLFCAGITFAREGDYVLRDGKAYRVQQGTSMLLEDCEPQTANTDKGLWSWILVDPGQTEAMKGSEGGIYFFWGEDKTVAGFLPIKEEASSCRLYFSPSGEKLLVNWGMEYIQHLSLYFIDSKKGFVKKAAFEVAGPPFWLDHHRFVFNAINPGKGARVKDRFDLWWSSVVLYDTVENEKIVLKEATANKNYSISDYDEASDELELWESSVKDVKDWEDENKVKDIKIKLPIPAAG
ncbi:MAG: hypothetical protein IKN64_06605 [Desulfovibrio sp.]|nr:hypothetical protein [Desulfovibrio sp.]